MFAHVSLFREVAEGRHYGLEMVDTLRNKSLLLLGESRERDHRVTNVTGDTGSGDSSG